MPNIYPPLVFPVSANRRGPSRSHSVLISELGGPVARLARKAVSAPVATSTAPWCTGSSDGAVESMHEQTLRVEIRLQATAGVPTRRTPGCGVSYCSRSRRHAHLPSASSITRKYRAIGGSCVLSQRRRRSERTDCCGSARPARLPPLKRPACVSPIALEGALDCSLGRFSTLPHGIGWHDPGYCTTNVPTMPFWACPGTAHR